MGSKIIKYKSNKINFNKRGGGECRAGISILRSCIIKLDFSCTRIHPQLNRLFTIKFRLGRPDPCGGGFFCHADFQTKPNCYYFMGQDYLEKVYPPSKSFVFRCFLHDRCPTDEHLHSREYILVSMYLPM